MLIEMLEWFLGILENDGYDIREEKGRMKMAIAMMRGTDYDFERKKIAQFLIGKEKNDAE